MGDLGPVSRTEGMLDLVYKNEAFRKEDEKLFL